MYISALCCLTKYRDSLLITDFNPNLCRDLNVLWKVVISIHHKLLTIILK